jgi:hypothetical protein
MKNTERILLWVIVAAILIGGGYYFWNQKCKESIISIDKEKWEKENSRLETAAEVDARVNQGNGKILHNEIIQIERVIDTTPQKIIEPIPLKFTEDLKVLYSEGAIEVFSDEGRYKVKSRNAATALKKIFEKHKVPYTAKCIEA